MTAKKATRRAKPPKFEFTGQTTAVSGNWHAIYFEARGDGGDDETVTVLPVALWVTCVRDNRHVVGGMVAGMSGLEFAEIDADFRGYLSEDTADGRQEFMELWDEENGYGGAEDSDDDNDPDEEQE